MLRFAFKLLTVLVMAALLYGLWAMYQEKTPEEKQEFREKASLVFRDTGRTLGQALVKTVEKGKSLFQKDRGEEGSKSK